MKKLLIGIALFLGLVGFAQAASIFSVFQGGTGVGTFTSSQLIYGNGILPLSSVATTSVTCAGTASCTSFTAIGPSPITITGSGGSGGGDPFTHTSVYGQTTSATSTLIALTGSPFSLVASSTVNFVNASTTVFSASGMSFLTGFISSASSTINGQLNAQAASTTVVSASNASSWFSAGVDSTTLPALTLGTGANANIYGISFAGGRAMVGFNGNLLLGGGATKGIQFKVNGTTNGFDTGTLVLSMVNGVGNGGLGSMVMGTSSAYNTMFMISSSTAPQLTLTDGVSANTPWAFRAIGNSFFLATSTATATSTSASFSINPNGLVTLTSLAGGSTLCVQANSAGQLSLAAAACGTGGGTAGDPFTHPTTAISATTTLLLLSGNASTTVFSDFGTGFFGGSATTTIVGNNATSSFASNVEIGTTTDVGGASGVQGAALTISNALTKEAGLVINLWTNVVNALRIFKADGSIALNIDTTATVAGWGVGSSTPWGTLDAVGDGTNPIFVVSTSTSGTASSTQPIFMIDNNYHVVTGGPQPTFSACGTAPTITGNDNVMRINTGTAGLTECIVNFAKTWNLAPVCSVDEEGTTATVTLIASSSVTQLRIGLSASLTGASLGVKCMGLQ